MGKNNKDPVVGVIMGSKSDWEIMKNCCDTLKLLKIKFDARVISAHRTPKRLEKFINYAEKNKKKLKIGFDPKLHSEKQLNFLLKVRDEVSRANQTIVDIRKVKDDLDYLLTKVSDKPQIVNIINDFRRDLYVIENKIHMTKNQSRQDPLNFGIRINNRIAFLLADSQRGDYPPTDQSIEFFNVIKKELEIEISNFKKVLNTYTMQINNMIEDNNIKFISF